MNFFEQYRVTNSKKLCSSAGWAILAYVMIMNVSVIGYIMIHAFVRVFLDMLPDEILWSDFNDIAESGVGYFIAIAIFIALLVAWKKPAYMRQTVLKPGKPMDIKSFFMLMVVFLMPQLPFVYANSIFEAILNGFGYSIQQGIDSATGVTSNFSMFLYIGLGAPIMEELLFRGVVIRTLEPMGKKFAIICSALMFGVFHSNLLQIPHAFVVGLVLGYVALEYNIVWAMVLHLFNNMILGDTLSRLLPGDAGPALTALVIIGSFIAGIVVIAVNFGKIRQFCKNHFDQPQAYRSFFASPGVIVLLVYSVVSTIFTLIATIVPV